MNHLTRFKKFSDYLLYINSDDAILPNYSYCADKDKLFYKPEINYIIKYNAPSKLVETTSSKNNGIHTNSFYIPFGTHEFEDGKGTITFSNDILLLGENAF